MALRLQHWRKSLEIKGYPGVSFAVMLHHR